MVLTGFPRAGPEVMKRILQWMGFSEFRILQHVQNRKQPHKGRLGLLAARTPGYFDYFDQNPNKKNV